MTCINSDAAAILSSIHRHHKQLLVKRKFLMGLCDAPELINEKKGSLAGNRQVSMIPETFLRKDDVFYEDLKELVGKGSEAHATAIRQLNNMEIGDLKCVSNFVATSLDDFSNHGLCSLAKIVTRDSVTFYKTRTQMKKVIKKGLLDIYNNQCQSYQVEILSELRQVLQNSKNFRHNHSNYLTLTLKSHNAVENVVNELKDMSLQTLIAMHRKLRGVHGYVPQLYPPKTGWSKDRLIDQVKKLCSDMIHQLGETNELPEPLAKAMTVAGLSTRVAKDGKDVYEAGFVHVTPELKALQNEIVKAIRSLKQRFKKKEIKTLQQVLDPESEVDNRGLKVAIRNMLIEFLFECCDMEVIPDSLIKALSIINKTPCRLFSKDSEAHEEVECILNVGAHLRQILWDYVPNNELDQDFADAYMEELEESDDGDIFDGDDDNDNDNDNKLQLQTDTLHQLHIRFNDFMEEVQSTGDPEPNSFKSEGDSENTNESSSSSFGATTFGDDDVECLNTVEMLVSSSSQSDSSPLGSPMSLKSANFPDGQDPKGDFYVVSTTPAGDQSEQIPIPEQKNVARNQYISLQEVSDRASVVAYHLTEYLLKGLDSPSNPTDKDDGDPFIVQAIRQVIPLFPNSEMETVKKFMSS